MASLARRTLVLVFARLTNQALSFLGPLFMVRLLSVEEYGQYRDFLLYGALILPWIQLNVNSSLAYFVPKEPDKDRLYLSQATYFILCTSLIALGFVWALGDYLPSIAIRPLVVPLCLYVFFFANLDAWEVYWIAKRQTINVFYYSVIRLGIRTAVVVAAAYLTRDVGSIIWTLVAFEGARMLALLFYGMRYNLFIPRIDGAAMRKQLDFSLPLGASRILFNLNVYVGQLVVSMLLGPAMLALYTVGTYLQPIVAIFRNSIADVIMPDIVSRRDVPPNVALGLWQRATVVYCAVMLPLAAALVYYASVVVETLFTSAYAAAVPVFQIFTLMLVRECFDFALPLRAVNRTGVFFVGSVLSLIINVLLIFVLFERLGVLAPAVARIVTVFVAGVYLAVYVMKHCGFTLATMLPWSDMGKIVLATVAGLPILFAGEWLDVAPLIRAALCGGIYIGVYAVLLRLIGLPELDDILRRFKSRGRARPTQS